MTYQHIFEPLYNLTETLHKYGICVSIQINHAGASAVPDRIEGLQPVFNRCTNGYPFRGIAFSCMCQTKNLIFYSMTVVGPIIFKCGSIISESRLIICESGPILEKKRTD